ncbi:MAG TPA: hypothetical protein VF588_07290 [Pyrinomonadaceae bacterium]|jgi:hypothetical protein
MIKVGGKIYRRALWCALALICSVASHPARAQKASKRVKADESVAAVRQAAASSLEAAIDELRDVEDYPARVEMSGDIVRLLGKRNPERCRQLLDSLFEDVLKARPEQTAPPAQRQESDRVVRGVIRQAAGFDSALAGAYTERYAEVRRQEVSPSAAPGGGVSPAVADLYLRLATDLVESDAKLAVMTARRALAAPVNGQTLVFLETLRQKEPALAADFLTAATQSVAARGGNDVNELFLLYSHVFSPLQVLSVAGGRLIVRQMPEYLRLVRGRAPDAGLAVRFLPAAAQIILDPNRYAGGADRLTAGLAGDLYFVGVIEPQVRAGLPALAESLAVRRGYLAGALDSAQSKSTQETLDRWRDSRGDAGGGGDAGAQTVESLLQRASEASDDEARDRTLYRAATLAVKGKQYDAALEAAGRMTAKGRDAAVPFITYIITEAKIKDGAFEEAEQWARKDGEKLRRAYLFTLLADALARGPRKDLAHASQLLGEVEQAAADAGPGPERTAMLGGAANVYARYDRGRALALLGESVSSANKIKGFTGESAITRGADVGGFFFAYEFYGGEFSFLKVVARQGRESFQPTLSAVQGLKERAPRLKAVVAACGAVMSRE